MGTPLDQTVRLVRVVVVSPGDVAAEREALDTIVDELNREAVGYQVRLWRWETDVYPGLHLEGPQGLIDELMDIDQADLVVGIFWKRFGTPTMEADSGTEHELRRAWSAWRANGRPEVMVYFSERPASSRSTEDAEQSLQVWRFRSDMPREQLWWAYEEPIDFERLVRQHIRRFIARAVAVTNDRLADAADELVLDVPRFPGALPREQLARELETMIAGCGLISVEGLPGSGKTYFLADYLTRRGLAGTTPWFDPPTGATIDDLLAGLAGRFKFTGLSATAKAMQLMRVLEERELAVVIEDFHRVDATSFAPLLRLAVESPGPARVIVTSRSYVDVPSSVVNPGRLLISGLERTEVESLLRARQVSKVSSDQIDDLCTKVEGLPIAIEAFCSLVVEFGRRPADLLSGSMVASQRLRQWFRELLDELPPEARELLRFLSLASVPFNLGLVRMAGRRLDTPDVEPILESLQRVYLVHAYSPYRWTVHQLVAALATGEPRSRLTVRQIHAAYAAHYLRGWRKAVRHELDDEVFSRLVNGCRHLQAAGRHDQAVELLNALSRQAKASGHYATFISLGRVELGGADADPWLRYNVAHCANILGYEEEADETLANLLSTDGLPADLLLAASRLRAEMLLARGKADLALSAVQAALAEAGGRASPRVRAHTRQIEARIRGASGDRLGAIGILQELLVDAERHREKRGAAIALTQLGYLDLEDGDPNGALARFVHAVELFREVGDRRGLSWSLLGTAEAQLGDGQQRTALRTLEEGLQIRSEIGEASREYLDEIERIAAAVPEAAHSQLLAAERARLGEAYAQSR